jgi:AraC-like DNA-binding protein
MHRPTTVGVVQVLDLLAALSAMGLDGGPLCRAAGLSSSVLRDPAARVPATAVVRLLAEAERRTGDALIGLHAGEHADPRGPLAYLLLATPRLEEGVRQMERLSQLVVDTMRVHLRRGPHAAGIVVNLGEPLERSRHVVDYSLMVMGYMFQATVGDDFHLLEVHVRHAPVGDPAETARAFGCAVRFNQTDDRLVFPVRFLEAKSRGANPLIGDQIEKFTAALLAQLTPKDTFRGKVTNAARALLVDGRRADRATVARRLHVSPRTLQRRLEEERTSFTAVRDAVLWEVVEALMSNRELKVETVALSVGFGEVAAFSKAFKRHMGCAPTQYRARLAARGMRHQRPHPDSPHAGDVHRPG